MRELVRRKIGINTHWLILVLMVVPSSLTASALYTKKQVVAYGKALDVAKLDPTLRSQRLDEWMRSGPAHLEKVTWEMSDCDLKPSGSPNYVAPMCVKVRIFRGNVAGWIIITIGTFRAGIRGEPHLDHIFVVSANGGGAPDSSNLSDLPRLLDAASSAGGR